MYYLIINLFYIGYNILIEVKYFLVLQKMEKHLIRTILIIMASIGQVEYRMHDNFIGIYKEGILFAKVYTENLYLLNNQGIFCQNR